MIYKHGAKIDICEAIAVMPGRKTVVEKFRQRASTRKTPTEEVYPGNNCGGVGRKDMLFPGQFGARIYPKWIGVILFSIGAFFGSIKNGICGYVDKSLMSDKNREIVSTGVVDNLWINLGCGCLLLIAFTVFGAVMYAAMLGWLDHLW